MRKRLAILVGGYPLTHFELSQILCLKAEDTYLVAVDGGLNVFFEHSILPDIVLGDMDSCSMEAYKWYCHHSTKQLFFPCDKDFLDMEAAINLINTLRIHEVYMFGVLGGRIDQTFSCLPFLLRGASFGLSVTIQSENCQMGVLEGPSINALTSESGDGWSFLAVSDCVEGLSLKGFKFKLDNERLFNTQTTALSNLAKSSKVTIGIKKGILIYFKKPGRQENVEYKESF